MSGQADDGEGHYRSWKSRAALLGFMVSVESIIGGGCSQEALIANRAVVVVNAPVRDV